MEKFGTLPAGPDWHRSAPPEPQRSAPSIPPGCMGAAGRGSASLLPLLLTVDRLHLHLQAGPKYGSPAAHCNLAAPPELAQPRHLLRLQRQAEQQGHHDLHAGQGHHDSHAVQDTTICVLRRACCTQLLHGEVGAGASSSTPCRVAVTRTCGIQLGPMCGSAATGQRQRCDPGAQHSRLSSTQQHAVPAGASALPGRHS